MTDTNAPNDATRAQINAADPAANTWVTANAGSGKTHVLTNRVAQLLLNGTKPARILCLTYTKAAAAEMQNRLFERLGEWAMMPDENLRKALAELDGSTNTLDAESLRKARRLFAGALETPGGLKIQTIHAFCDAILRRFPVEAGVAPQFDVLEDRQAKLLRSELIERLAKEQTQIFDDLAEYFTGSDTDQLTSEIINKRQGFLNSPQHSDFGITPETTILSLKKLVLSGTEKLLESVINYMRQGSASEAKNAEVLHTALQHPSDDIQLKSLEKLFLFGAKTKNPFGAKIDAVPTKKVLKADDPIRESINALAYTIQQVREQRVGLLNYNRTKTLHNFAHAFLDQYDVYKAATAKLDYDDLIQITAKLLTQSSMAQWVLYRLDGGLDHILVDEAQDTSPAQWAVIKQLANEFTQDAGLGHTPRTLFVVGDEKQSIYSFQGADPIVFGEMKQFFDEEFRNIQRPLQDRALLHSFRSAPPILDYVDQVFSGVAGNGMDKAAEHKAFFDQKPGRVDIWPFVLPEDKPDDVPWYKPVDLPAPNNPNIILGQQIADEIDQIITSKQLIQVGKVTRPATAGDFLILVQNRKELFHAILKALKTKGIPVAGADVINVGEELAVRDILSLLKFIALADDDLSLAEAMRSPLLGLSEGELFTFAYGRKGTLWQSFRDSSDHTVALDMLRDIRANADYLRPYELIERILIKHKGRDNLVARLGAEITDGLDELLSQAMRYEQLEAPTLTGFLSWFETGKVEIKREMDSGTDQVRLMTIHGAKGLESPIVILPDTGNKSVRDRGQIIIQDGIAHWKIDESDATLEQANTKAKNKELQTAEKMRLLYVAMTRAESWLIICGAGKRTKTPDDWYQYMSDAMSEMDNVQPLDFGELGTGYSYTNPAWHHMQGQEITKPTRPHIEPPTWLYEPAEKMPRPEQPLAPSKLAGAKALADTEALDLDAALVRGSQLHLLLEHLPNHPKDTWATVAKRIVGDDASALLDEANQVLSNPKLQYLFGENSYSEVAITAKIAELNNRTITGFIDRLIIEEDTITAVDFKSNAGVPESAELIPQGILAQQAAYLLALQQIYPNHTVEVAILWTRTCEIMSIPHKIAINALNQPQHLDDSGQGS